MEDIEIKGESMLSSPFQNKRDSTFSQSDLLLDTGDICFLCLGDSSNQNLTSLKLICRYLKIHPDKLLSNNILKENLDIDEKVISSLLKCKKQFQVNLCSSCSSLINQFTSLITQLEITEMLMTRKLQELHEILKAMNDSQWKCVQGKMLAKCTDPVKVHLVEKLRLATQEKCFSKFESLTTRHLPTVLIERLKPGTCQVSETDSVTNSQLMETSESEPQSDFSEIPQVPQTGPKILAGTPPVQKSGSRKEIFSEHIKTEEDSQFQCRHCDIRHRNSHSIQRHLVTSHVEKFFVCGNSPNTFLKEFASICSKFLRRECDIAKTGPFQQLICHYCESDRFMKSPTHFKIHLISEHYAEILRKLGKYPDEQAPGFRAPLVPHKLAIHAILEKNFDTVEPGNRKRCCHCQYETDRPRPVDAIRKHLVTSHPERVLIEAKIPTVSEKDFTSFCQKLMTSHTIRADDEMIRKFCGFCGKNYSKEYECMLHLVTKHYTDLMGKLNRLQLGDPEKEVLKISKHVKPGPARKHKLKRAGDADTKRRSVFVCERARGGCGQKLTTFENLQRHQLTACKRRRIKSRKKLYRCNAGGEGCGKSFLSVSGMTRHKRAGCGQENGGKLWVCNPKGCGRKYKSWERLRFHQKENCRMKRARELKDTEDGSASVGGQDKEEPKADTDVKPEGDTMTIDGMNVTMICTVDSPVEIIKCERDFGEKEESDSDDNV